MKITFQVYKVMKWEGWVKQWNTNCGNVYAMEYDGNCDINLFKFK